MTRKTEALQQYPLKSLSAAVSAICAGVPMAQAQDTGQEDSLTIEEVLVTATKRGALNLQDVPMSITAFTDEDITAQGFKRLDDYAGQIPSLAFGRREPGGSNVIMRGCAISGISFSDNPTTSVYLDEQPITSAGFNPDPRLVDIERVEALSGPQGTLFREASQCGTLRIITNKPDATQRESWVDLTGTSVKHGELGYDISAMANLPLVEDKLALRLVGFTARDAGYIDNVLGASPGNTFNNADLFGKDVNSSTTTGARLSLRWTPNEDWTFDAQAIYQKTEADGFGDTDLPEGVYAGRDLGQWEQLRFIDETWEDEWYQIALNAEGDLGWATLTVAAGFAHRDTRYEADASAYLHSFQQIGDYIRSYYNPYATIYDFGGDPLARAIDNRGDDRVSFEARLSTSPDLSSRWSAVAGVFYNKVENDPTSFTSNVIGLGDNCNEYYAASPGCVGAFTYLSYLHYYYFGTVDKVSDNWWSGVYENKFEQKSVFGEFTFNVTENFDITVGGRWYDIDTSRRLTNGTLIEPPESVSPNCGTDADKESWQVDGIPVFGVDTCYTDEIAESSESGFVPKVNLTYRFDDNKMIYATYSEGFRRGGANAARRNSVFGAGSPFHTYDSDTLRNFEIGAKTTWLDGRFQWNITVFDMIWEDIQIEAEDPQPLLFTLGVVNFPEAEIKGVETDFTWIPALNWTVSGTLGYNDGTLSKDAVLFPESDNPKVAVSGTRLPIMPKWKGSLLVRKDFDTDLWGGRPYVQGVVQAQDKSFNSLEGIQSIIADNPVREQPAYGILNLRLGLDGDSWSTTFFIDNVTNKYARQFYNDRWAKTRLSVNRPRTFGINFRKTFY